MQSTSAKPFAASTGPPGQDKPISDANIQAVQRIYEAYGRGDVDGVLAEVADDVDWAAEAASKSVPWYGDFSGKNGVPRFFAAIGSSVTDFTLLSFASNETDVIVALRRAFTVKATGKTSAMHMLHWWRLADGKVVRFRGSEDTEQSAAALS